MLHVFAACHHDHSNGHSEPAMSRRHQHSLNFQNKIRIYKGPEVLNYMIVLLYLIAFILSTFYASEAFNSLIGKLSPRRTALSSSTLEVTSHISLLFTMALEWRSGPESGRVHALDGRVKVEETHRLDRLGNPRRQG